MTITTRTRKSRFLFQWEASDGLDYQGRLVARTGQIGTFTRGGTAGAASAIDAAGKVYVPGVSSPRFTHQYSATTGLFEPVGLLLEGARTNLVVQSDALTAANGWTFDGTAAATAAYSTLGSLSLTRFTGAAAGDVWRTLTLTGNAVKACSAVVQFDAVAGTSVHTLLYDATAAATRCQVTVTWAADGTATAVADTGTLFAFVRLADVSGMPTYRILAQSTSATAANTHRVYPMGGGGSASSFRIGAVQVEDALSPGSVISTTTAAVTRSADALSFALNAIPQTSTWYAKFTEAGTATGSTVAGVLGIGEGTNPALFLLGSGSGGYAFLHRRAADVSSAPGVSPVTGDLVELRGVLNADGSVLCGISVNAAAEVVAAASAANALATAWNSTLLQINDRGGSAGAGAFQSVRIAAGVQTMDYMRAG